MEVTMKLRNAFTFTLVIVLLSIIGVLSSIANPHYVTLKELQAELAKIEIPRCPECDCPERLVMPQPDCPDLPQVDDVTAALEIIFQDLDTLKKRPICAP